ncbi:cytochrome C oxidase subunit IV family protein [Mycobacteroides salmoniphilum]|uniref:cytochrome C oxidase subunit IV family protein n=2 Tax=Mycobacteroides salmoniphilum TaxID=404941 RepID=UPI0010AA3222|nr:cytochrome C oxidase subunit IV family protein [Mycobacteroides salmoniphilum]QCH24193.1 hypothetical protein DSM43276_02456 [Mycobacteroides salmoniphilum]
MSTHMALNIRTDTPVRVIATWAVLVAASLASAFLSHDQLSAMGIAGVLMLAAFKALLVMGEYIEIRRAPIWLIAVCGLWTGGVSCCLILLIAAPAWTLTLLGQ